MISLRTLSVIRAELTKSVNDLAEYKERLVDVNRLLRRYSSRACG